MIYFRLFANCVLTMGTSRGIIADLQNGIYFFVEKSVGILLEDLKFTSIKDYCIKNSSIELDTLKDFLQKLVDDGIGHYTNNLQEFPALSLDNSSPYQLHDCILEVSETLFINKIKIFDALTQAGCQTLELRSYGECSLTLLESFLEGIESTRIRSVKIVVG